MGTVFSVHVVPGRSPASSSVSPAALETAFSEAGRLLHHLDDVFSLWKPDSPMSRLRDGAISLDEAPDEIGLVLDLCAHARDLSGGWFDPWAMLGGVDPSGLVKGWAGELVLGLLQRAGGADVMVNAGGDVVTSGRAPDGGPWRIGIQHPWRGDALACVIEADGAVATSGRYERGDHLQDPFDPLRAPTSASATVTGPSLALADALATGLAVGGMACLDLIDRLPGYEAYLITGDGGEEATNGLEMLTEANPSAASVTGGTSTAP